MAMGDFDRDESIALTHFSRLTDLPLPSPQEIEFAVRERTIVLDVP